MNDLEGIIKEVVDFAPMMNFRDTDCIIGNRLSNCPIISQQLYLQTIAKLCLSVDNNIAVLIRNSLLKACRGKFLYYKTPRMKKFPKNIMYRKGTQSW